MLDGYTGPVPCAFLWGNPGDDCKRCGATWVQHYGYPPARRQKAKAKNSKAKEMAGRQDFLDGRR